MTKQAVFVLGMGRSGTSALARVLSLCGGSLPARLLPAHESNPEGHWEPAEAIEVDDAFLFAHGSTWFDPSFRLQDETEINEAEKEAFIERVGQLLKTWPAGDFLVIKEPRITALANLWFEATRRLGLAISVVIPVRHPEEVTASLIRRDGMSRELATMLWLKYSLLAERKSRGVPRVFVSYRALLDDWRGQFARISDALSLSAENIDAPAIDALIRPDLYRERHNDTAAWNTDPLPLTEVYRMLLAATTERPLDLCALDRIYAAFNSYERTVRLAYTDFQQRFAPPSPISRFHEAIETARAEQIRVETENTGLRAENDMMSATNNALNTANDTLRVENDMLRAETAILRSHGDALREAQARAERAKADLWAENEHLNAAVARLHVEENTLRAEAGSLRHQIADIRESTSWRVTAPIRTLKLRLTRLA